jgi:hypothetical protein
MFLFIFLIFKNLLIRTRPFFKQFYHFNYIFTEMWPKAFPVGGVGNGGGSLAPWISIEDFGSFEHPYSCVWST